MEGSFSSPREKAPTAAAATDVGDESDGDDDFAVAFFFGVD